MLASDLPQRLTAELERARSQVDADPDHDLRLGLRRLVWVALDDEAGGPAGQRRRARLAIASARRTLGLWSRALPDHDLPARLIERAEQVLHEAGPATESVAAVSRAWADVEQLADSVDHGPWMFAGFAAVCALRTAALDEPFDPGAVDPAAVDDEMDPYERDASFMAAVAWSVTEGEVSRRDPRRRHEFWRWWIDEAVVDAYRAES